jgi:hypothetical protein
MVLTAGALSLAAKRVWFGGDRDSDCDRVVT